jgi:tRNA dimethylallyltransferase
MLHKGYECVERTIRMTRRFPVIMGPTAGGKTALAVETALALRGRGIDAEIVSADSVQVYRHMDIGSAKPTAAERGGVPHHMIDVQNPGDRFTVKDWLDGAERAIDEIRTRGGVPVVAGGTHLYIKALLEGLFEGPEPDETLREELRAASPGALRAELERTDPDAARRIHPADLRRTVRAIEVQRLTGKTITEQQTQWDRGRRRDAFLVGVRWTTEAINRRINARVREMMEAGFLDEVRKLVDQKALGPQAREALGYKQLAEHIAGRSPLPDAVERIKIDTRRFAKNQRTWIRRLGLPHAAGGESDESEKFGSRTPPDDSLTLDGPGLTSPKGMQDASQKILERIFQEP